MLSHMHTWTVRAPRGFICICSSCNVQVELILKQALEQRPALACLNVHAHLHNNAWVCLCVYVSVHVYVCMCVLVCALV